MKIHYAWWIVLACCAIISCTGIVSVSAGNFYMPVAEDLGIGIGKLTLYVTTYSLTMALLFPTAGRLLAKRLKLTLLFGGLSQYISLGLMGTFHHVYAFYIAGFFIGVGSSITMFMAVPILINMWFISKKGLAMGIALSFSGIAGVIFSPVAGYAISTIGWRGAYFFLAACGLLIFIPAVLFLVKTPEEKGLRPYGADTEEDPQSTQNKEQGDPIRGQSFSEAFRNPIFYCLLIFSMCMASASALATQIAPIASGHFGLTATAAASMLSLFCLGEVIGKLLLGGIDDKLGHRKTLLIGIGVILLSQLLLFGSCQSKLIIAPTFILVGIGMAGVFGILPPLMTADIFGLRDYNRIWAYVMTAGCLAGAFATPIYGTIFDRTGSYLMVFVVVIILSLIGLVTGMFSLRQGVRK